MQCKHEIQSDGHFEDDAGVIYFERCIHCQESRTRSVENYFPTQEEIDEWADMLEEEARKAEIEARRDIRTLCYRCARDMLNAGIHLERVGTEQSRCDKCSRPGSDWEVK